MKDDASGLPEGSRRLQRVDEKTAGDADPFLLRKEKTRQSAEEQADQGPNDHTHGA